MNENWKILFLIFTFSWKCENSIIDNYISNNDNDNNNNNSKKVLINSENTFKNNFDILTTNNPCLVHYCTKGRECIINGYGNPECICQRWCTHRKKSVCGTNGVIYDNHCELHRAACLLDQPLGLQRMEKCLLILMKPSKLIKTDEQIIITENDTIRSNENNIDLGVTTTVVAAVAAIRVQSNNVTDFDPLTFNNLRKNKFSYLDSSKLNESFGIVTDKDMCTQQEYEIMKDNLLLYNHERLMSQDNNHSKNFLVSIMFSHYDLNNNGHLDYEELQTITLTENLDELSNGCKLNDMLRYDDTDHDNELSINEFNQAFSKLYSVSVVSLDKSLEINHLSARVDDNVEIKCDVTGSPSPPIIWKRNNVDLSILNEDEVRVFNDGSLYLTRIQLIHAGNYTCHAQRNKDIVQTHVLTVHTIPEVHVVPRIQSKQPGEHAEIICHPIGVPYPKIDWLKNDELIKLNDSATRKKYDTMGNGTVLIIYNIEYSDTAAYMCQATNIGGSVRDISSLIVEDEPTPTIVMDNKKFIAFHEYGIAIYEADGCRLYHQIQGTDIIPGTGEYVCGGKNTIKCSWGQAINVGINYIYISQPDLDRVLIFSILQMTIVDIVTTDRYPVEIFYVPHCDQVWILNWRYTNNTNSKVIQVIRDARKKQKHHTVHPEPIDGQFDLVDNLFIPSAELELSHYNFKYGYVTHKNQRGLYKLDLANLRYMRSIDLTLYNCVPQNIVFSAIYGYVILSCREPITNRPQGQLILDYLTDAILTLKPELNGILKLSPDSRNLAIIDHRKDGCVIVVVQKITKNGLEFLFDVKTNLKISDVTFYESQITNGYDLYASASDKEDILYLNLFTGKVEIITGVGTAIPPSYVKWNNPIRPIRASGLFGKYMITTAINALFIINGKSKSINCEIGGVSQPSVIIWTKTELKSNTKQSNIINFHHDIRNNSDNTKSSSSDSN